MYGNDLSGRLRFTETVYGDVGFNSMSGRIQIDGSFDGNFGGGIYVFGVDGYDSETAAITVDYNGWNSGDDWKDGAFVRRYNEDDVLSNRPSVHMWEVTPCKGDMNNDGSVNGQDITPFTTALSDPSQYEEDFPGLEGSMVWHGDMNCDGSLNGYDIEPFADFLEQMEPCCVSTCSGCDAPRGEGEGGMPPEDLAAVFTQAVDSGPLATFIGFVAGFAATVEGQAAEYWGDVVEYLSQ